MINVLIAKDTMENSKQHSEVIFRGMGQIGEHRRQDGARLTN